MGIDELTKPQLIRWAIKSKNLASDAEIVRAHNPEMGLITGGSRNTSTGSLLQWELIMPLSKPEVEIIPFMLDWSQSSTHPTKELSNANCELQELHAVHPKPEVYSKTMEGLGIDIQIKHGEDIALRAIIKSPNGLIEI